MDDDLGDYKLETTIHTDHVLHISYKRDPRAARKVAVEERWFPKEELGSGTFGIVRLEESQEGEKRAVKVIHKSRRDGVDYRRELAALTVFSRNKYRQHQVFVEFFGWWETSDSICLAMEYFPCGDLRACDNGQINEDDAREICQQLLEGLEIMHNKGYAHRDLKPHNIFVVQSSPSWWIKIGDFGISKRAKLEDSTELRTTTGTFGYEAPEIRHYVDVEDEDEENPHYTHAVDIWSLGCVVFKMNRSPFPHEPLEINMTTAGIDFLKQLLQPFPHLRLTANAALTASWVSLPRSIPLNTDTLLHSEIADKNDLFGSRDLAIADLGLSKVSENFNGTEIVPPIQPMLQPDLLKEATETPRDWFDEMKDFQACIDASRKALKGLYPSRVRIAILDTGVDKSHPDISQAYQDGRIKYHNFISKSDDIEDLDGHGTHCTSLVAKFAPNADIYVGRVFRQSVVEEENSEIMAEAIRYAKKIWRVDIISLSLGSREYNESPQYEIRAACAEGIIFFAAATSTRNRFLPISLLAWMQKVICVFSSNAYGRPSDFNPPQPHYSRFNFTFSGEKIEGAWPSYIPTEGTFERNGTTYKLLDGLSCATSIAAAVAAGVLEFSQQEEYTPWIHTLLKNYDGMTNVLKRIADNHQIGNNVYHVVKPWKLISITRANKDITIGMSNALNFID